MGVTAVEKVERLNTVKSLLDEGYSDVQIAEKTNTTLSIVKRQIRELDELSRSVISREEMHRTLLEVDKELIDALLEAKELFFKCKMGEVARDKDGNAITDSEGNVLYKHQHSTIRSYLQLWVDTAVKRAALYGLDKIKQEALIQVNTQNNYLDSSDVKFSASTLEKVQAEIIRQKSCKQPESQE